MDYTNSEILGMMMDRKTELRKAVSNPSDATLEAWKMEDFKDNIMLDHYEDEEMTADLQNIRTAFEVKQK